MSTKTFKRDKPHAKFGTNTPSHIETIREALDRELESCQDRLHHAVAASLRDDLRSRIDKLRAALASLESLSRQPAQAPDIDKIMEVVGGEANGAAERIAHEISEPRKALEQMCSFIRLRLCNELRVAPRQPAQTEDEIRQAAEVFLDEPPGVRDFPTNDTALVDVMVRFARSLSEPK